MDIIQIKEEKQNKIATSWKCGVVLLILNSLALPSYLLSYILWTATIAILQIQPESGGHYIQKVVVHTAGFSKAKTNMSQTRSDQEK